MKNRNYESDYGFFIDNDIYKKARIFNSRFFIYFNIPEPVQVPNLLILW